MGGPENGAPSRAPKSEMLPLFTTLELGPASQKGTPFCSHFGDLLGQKHEKRGFQKDPKNQLQKTLKMGPKQGGRVYVFRSSFTSTLLLERSWTSIFFVFWLRFEPQKHVLGPLDSPL